MLDEAGRIIMENVSVTDWTSFTCNERRSKPSGSVLSSKGASQFWSWPRKTHNPVGTCIGRGKYTVVFISGQTYRMYTNAHFFVSNRTWVRPSFSFESWPPFGKQTVRSFRVDQTNQDCFCLVNENSNRTSFYTSAIAYFVIARTVASSMSRVQSEHVCT